MRENFSISHFIGKYLFDKMYDGGESRYLLLCPEDGTGSFP